MRLIKGFFTLALSVISLIVYSQTGSVKGQAIDQQTKLPIANAHIFIPNTTYQTYADSVGNFFLPRLPSGKWTLLIKNEGWESFSKAIVVNPNGTTVLPVEMAQKSGFAATELGLSKSKRSKLMDQAYERLLGKDYKAIEIQILDEGANLIFEELAEKSVRVSSSGPFYITNNETGYLVTTYFEPFLIESDQRPVTSQVYFEIPVPEGKKIGEARAKKRLEIFNNSAQKYLSLLMEGKVDSFERNPNPSITVSSSKGDYFLSFERPVEITLPNGKRGSIDYVVESLEVKLNGSPVSNEQLISGGYFSTINPVFQLPSDLFGDRLISLANLEKTPQSMQEKVLLLTDRNHYLKGETLFFKANMIYAEPLLGPSLSKVLHLELIDTTGYLELHQVFLIKSGKAFGSIVLPVALDQENYFLRAYTSWSLNYGDQNSAFIPIQVHDPSLMPRSDLPKQNSVGVSIFTEKQFYGPDEPVNLNIMVQDQKGKPITSDLTISILDISQGLPVSTSQDLSEIAKIQTINSSKSLADFKLPLETAYSVTGSVKSSASTSMDGNVTALVNALQNMEKYKLDKDGSFVIPNLDFEDEFEIAIRAESRDGMPIRDISLEIQRYPTSSQLTAYEFPELIRTSVKPLTVEELQANMQEGEILMEEFTLEEVKADPRGAMIYGTPDNVVDPAKFQLNGNTAQFLYLLSGQVPGMIVSGNPPSVRLRGGEPLVFIDGVPINFPSGTTLGGGGPTGRSVLQIIEGINVFAIDRVEVIKRLVPSLGDAGRNGVISIFMKTGKDLELANEAKRNNFTSFKLSGYPIPSNFQDIQKVQLENPLLRGLSPTLYWNPEVITSELELAKKVQFKSSESGGPMWVEIRGISETGEILTGSFLINEQKK